MGCCGPNNHNSHKNAEGKALGQEQSSSHGHQGVQWVRWLIFVGLLAFLYMQFFRK